MDTYPQGRKLCNMQRQNIYKGGTSKQSCNNNLSIKTLDLLQTKLATCT